MTVSSKIHILIVEDELLIAQDMRLKLTQMGYEVIAIIPDAPTALLQLQTQDNIDLLIIDISLQGDMNGIDLATIISKKYQLPFIFLTSHTDQKIVAEAKTVQPASYLLKPFHAKQVHIAIEMAIDNYSNHLKSLKAPTSEPNNPMSDSLFLRKDNHFEKVKLTDILFLKAEGNYTTIYTKNCTYLYSQLLKVLEDQLPKTTFQRVHRSYIIHIKAIEGFEGNLLFINQHKIPISKSYRTSLFKMLPKL